MPRRRSATGTRDPILAERARHEQRGLADPLDHHDQLAVVPWQAIAPTGADALAADVTDAPRTRSAQHMAERPALVGDLGSFDHCGLRPERRQWL